MIYCVRFSDVDDQLQSQGYQHVAQTERTLIYANGPDTFTIRRPNVNGSIPEMIVNDAFDSAGLLVPVWNVFWCD